MTDRARPNDAACCAPSQPLPEADKAYKRMMTGQARFRVVLTV